MSQTPASDAIAPSAVRRAANRSLQAASLVRPPASTRRQHWSSHRPQISSALAYSAPGISPMRSPRCNIIRTLRRWPVCHTWWGRLSSGRGIDCSPGLLPLFCTGGMCVGRSSLSRHSLALHHKSATQDSRVALGNARQTENRASVSSHGWLRMLLRLSFLATNQSWVTTHKILQAAFTTGGEKRRPTEFAVVTAPRPSRGSRRIFPGPIGCAEPLCLSDDQPIAGEEDGPTHPTSDAMRWAF
jgi:hypothetical protein